MSVFMNINTIKLYPDTWSVHFSKHEDGFIKPICTPGAQRASAPFTISPLSVSALSESEFKGHGQSQGMVKVHIVEKFLSKSTWKIIIFRFTSRQSPVQFRKKSKYYK